MAEVVQVQSRTFIVLVSVPVNQVGILDSLNTALMHGVAVCSCNDVASQILEGAFMLSKKAHLIPKSGRQPLGCCCQLQNMIAPTGQKWCELAGQSKNAEAAWTTSECATACAVYVTHQFCKQLGPWSCYMRQEC